MIENRIYYFYLYLFSFVGMSGKLDIVYAIDTSESVRTIDLQRMKSFIKAGLDLHDLTIDTINVGLASYGKDATLALERKNWAKKPEILSAVDNIVRIGGENRIDKLLQFAQQSIFKPTQSPRDSKKLLVIFAKGDLSIIDQKDLVAKAANLKKNGVHIALVLFEGQERDSYRILTGNQVIYIKSSEHMPVIYPKVEQIIGGLLGKIILFIVKFTKSF